MNGNRHDKQQKRTWPLWAQCKDTTPSNYLYCTFIQEGWINTSMSLRTHLTSETSVTTVWSQSLTRLRLNLSPQTWWLVQSNLQGIIQWISNSCWLLCSHDFTVLIHSELSAGDQMPEVTKPFNVCTYIWPWIHKAMDGWIDIHVSWRI